MIIILLLLLFPSHIQPAGFAGHTKLLTKQSQKTFETVYLNPLVASSKNNFQPVLFFSKQTVAKIVQITIADETIICHKKQLFWGVNKNDWVYAKDLLPGDLLQTDDGQSIAVDKINIIQQKTELYSLTVGPPHYLYIGKNGIMAHNMTWFVGIGLELALECGAIELIKATFTVVVGAIALHLAKNKTKKKPKTSFTVKPACNSPQIDPDYDKKKYTYKNGIYEDADYHTTRQNGLKSPRPQDGQKALDNSYEVKGSDQRISIENDKFVILKRTSNQKYHGYVINWKELKMGGSKYQNKISKFNKHIN